MSSVSNKFSEDFTKGRQPIASLSYCAARATPHHSAWNPQGVVDMRITELTQTLLDGGDPNERDGHGCTPLMYVAAGSLLFYKDTTSINMPGRERATRILLAKGADPLAKDNKGRTVLDYFKHFVGEKHPATCLVDDSCGKNIKV